MPDVRFAHFILLLRIVNNKNKYGYFECDIVYNDNVSKQSIISLYCKQM